MVLWVLSPVKNDKSCLSNNLNSLAAFKSDLFAPKWGRVSLNFLNARWACFKPTWVFLFCFKFELPLNRGHIFLNFFPAAHLGFVKKNLFKVFSF